jgi:hypothetical protein
MINITPESKRVGWRLDEALHNRLVEFGREYNISLEDVGNIILNIADEYEVEKALELYSKAKLQRREYQKRVCESLSNIDISLLDVLSSISSEELAELLGRRPPVNKTPN